MIYNMISTYLTAPEMWLHGFTDGGPMKDGFSVASAVTAYTAAQGLTCDLAQRKVRRVCLMELISVKPTEMKQGRWAAAARYLRLRCTTADSAAGKWERQKDYQLAAMGVKLKRKK
jgi:hypothetical protein